MRYARKRSLRSTLLWLLAVVALIAAAAWWFRGPLAVRVAQTVLSQRIAADIRNELPDGLHVGLCGAGSPFPDDKRSGPCTLVIAGKDIFVFDAGNAATRNLGKMGVNHGQIAAVFLTHFHSDHIDGLGELLLQRWVSMGNAQPTAVYGPKGVERLVAGLRETYAQDQSYRVEHHGTTTLPPAGFGGTAKPFDVPAQGDVLVYQSGDVQIHAFGVDHAPVHPAVGYRIVYKGRSAVLSGDTRRSPAVLAQARGVDLLVHEALSPALVNMIGEAAQNAGRTHLRKLMTDIIDYHTTPEQAAQTAQEAGVRYLLLNHIAPPLPVPGLEEAFLGNARSVFQGPLRVGADGDLISLPAGSQDVVVGKRF